MLIKFPWHDVHSSSPRNSSTTSGLPRCTVGNVTRFRILRTKDILNPFSIESPPVKIMHDCDAGYLPIARIGRPFPMRAIACYPTMHVVSLASPPYLIDVVK